MKKIGKNSESCQFWQNQHEIFGCHGNMKHDGHTIDIL